MLTNATVNNKLKTLKSTFSEPKFVLKEYLRHAVIQVMQVRFL